MDKKRRSYDIYDIENRVHQLELSEGSTPEPTTWDYSTTETDTHQKWTDGKEIYCKVVTGTFNFKTSIITVMPAGDIENIIDFRASASGACISPQCYISDNNVIGVHFAQFNATSIVIYYTKKTTSSKSTRSTKR